MQPLVARSRDPNAGVRCAALEALAAIGGEGTFEAILECFAHDDDEVRLQAAAALGELRDKRAVPALVAALADEDSRMKVAAAKALGQLGDTAAVELLLAVLEAQRLEFRCSAALALARLGDLRGQQLLEKWARETQGYVRDRAIEAWIEASGERRDGFLISSSFGRQYAYLEPGYEITDEYAIRAAKWASMEIEAARARFEVLAPLLGLKLTWKA